LHRYSSAHLTATPENRFLLDWYGSAGHVLAPRTHACSHPLCGRVETRRHEFRRCSCCGGVRYCSRACQSMDWRLQHKVGLCKLSPSELVSAWFQPLIVCKVISWF
jgi:hypothetical protein